MRSLAAALFVSLALYCLRIFERLMGSPRFGLFLVLTLVWATASRGVLILAGGPLAAAGLSSGPLEIIAALMVYYARACGLAGEEGVCGRGCCSSGVMAAAVWCFVVLLSPRCSSPAA